MTPAERIEQMRRQVAMHERETAHAAAVRSKTTALRRKRETMGAVATAASDQIEVSFTAHLMPDAPVLLTAWDDTKETAAVVALDVDQAAELVQLLERAIDTAKTAMADVLFADLEDGS